MKNNRILFYSSVKEISLFYIQRFYAIDIFLLKENGYDVHVTNKIYSFLKFWKYNIAFIYFYRYGLFAGIIAKIFGKKVFYTGGIDSLDVSMTLPKKYRIQKIFFKCCRLTANNCIIVSHSDMDNIKKIYKNTLPSKLSFSYHSIDIQKFNSTLQNKEKFFTTIVWMGEKGNTIRKGVDVAIKVFAFLTKKEEFKNYKFIIIGKKGSGTTYIENLCKELQVSDKVHFTGSISEDEKIDILKKSQFYFQLSIYEGFGIAALEALAAKNIVIHSGKGGLKDTIKDYGIKYELSIDESIAFSTLYQNIESFDVTKLTDAEKYLNDYFSHTNRQIDLLQILSK
jgi:glycosyltransferase involved in cell wall biosynthesis